MEVCHFFVDKRLIIVDVSPWADSDALQPSLQGQDVNSKSFFFKKKLKTPSWTRPR